MQTAFGGGSIGDHLPPWFTQGSSADPEEAMLSAMRRLAARFPANEG